MKPRERRCNGPTASVITLRPLLAFAQAHRVDTGKLLASVGIHPSELDDFDRRIPESDRQQVWREVAIGYKDEAFGLLVAGYGGVGVYDVLDYALCYSATLQDAFGRLLRFHRILCDAWALELKTAADQVHVIRTSDDLERHESDAFAALLLLRAREITGTSIAPRVVRFAHQKPRNVGVYVSAFSCPVRFRCATTELVFERAALALRVRNDNSGLAAVLDRHMRDLLARLPRLDDFIQNVHQVVSQMLHGSSPGLAATARALRASTRTVQRRLRDHGTTHRQVVDTVRRALAERLVYDEQLSLTEIAFLVGFSEVSGFRRWFKGWTGATPAQVQARRR